jgi:hypothetical protein
MVHPVVREVIEKAHRDVEDRFGIVFERRRLRCDCCDRMQRFLVCCGGGSRMRVCNWCFEAADKIAAKRGCWPEDADFAELQAALADSALWVRVDAE